MEKEKEEVNDWAPKTRAGRMVQSGEIKDFDQLYALNVPILEPEMIDYLVPDLKEEVLDIHMVRRTTDSGRKGSFVVTVAVGNGSGYVGVGMGKAINTRPAIERAIRNAKLNLIKVVRGCGSWECGCGEPHSVPFKVTGKSRSVGVTLIPAPKGTGLVCGKTARTVLTLAGIKDVWCKTSGQTQTVFNFAKATFDALKQIRKMKTLKEKKEKVNEHENSSS